MALASDVAARLQELTPAGQRALLSKLVALRNDRGRMAPLSYAQEQLWFLEKINGGNPFYNESSAVRFFFPIDTAAIARTVNEITRRHEILRTSFEDADGEPVQRVLPSLEIDVPLVDLTHLPRGRAEEEARRIADNQANEPFDLRRAPVMRFVLVRLGPADHIFVMTMHHIVCDGWSTKVFLDEFFAIYTAFVAGRPSPLPPLTLQFSDYALWQRERVSGKLLEEQLQFWKKQLAGVQPLELPADKPRPPVPSYRGGRERLSIPEDTARRLRALCGRESITPFMALFSAFCTVLHRYSGQDDLAVGCPVANRNRAEFEQLIGFFVNAFVLRADVSGNPTFRELLQRVRAAALAAYAHQDVPFEKIVEHVQPERDPSRNPLFQVTFQLLGEKGAKTEIDVSGELVRELDVTLSTSKFDLRCDLWPAGERFAGYIEYSSDLFERETVEAMARYFETIVAALVDTPDMPIQDVRLTALPSRQQSLEAWNDTAVAFPPALPVHRRFEAIAAASPNLLALQQGGERLTYGELNVRANQLARLLGARGVRPGALVVLLLDRSTDLVVSALAVLKAGAAYVPLDPAYPPERLSLLTREARAPLAITTPEHRDAIPPYLPALVLDRETARAAAKEPGDDLPPMGEAGSLAYVIFTSGSTGTPRGVEIVQSSLNNLVDWHRREYAVTERDRATLCASPAFDASVWEMWPYLATGASLHIPDTATWASSEGLAAWMAENAITISFLPTPMAELFVAAPQPAGLALRALLTGGDKLRSHPERQLPYRFVNHYGPTECTVVATYCDVVPSPGSPPIGRPIANIRAFVLDPSGRPVPPGARGELYLGGAGLARGYLDDVGLTRQRFVDTPFGRLYRTGDLVRQRLDNMLEFHGRADSQIKLRGYRIEPGEIESAIDEHPLVRTSLVVAREKPDGEKVLVAYLVPEPDVQPADAAAASHVSVWETTYEQLYSTSTDAEDETLDIVGWNSSYTGEPLPADQMREQFDAVAERIRALGARRILEIGCGTGLLLTRLAGSCDRYVGTDFSAAALARVRRVLARRDWPHVELLERRADDFAAIEPASFDAVVLHSVVQYFPNVGYLMNVLAGAARAVRPGGFVFAGDLRNLRLMRVLHEEIERVRAGAGTTEDELRERIDRRGAQEVELLLDPELFRALPGHFAGVSASSVQVRRGRHHNELTRFRYDALLQIGGEAPPTPPAVERAWTAVGTVDALRELAREHPAVRVRGIPSARLDVNGVEPEEIWDAARDAGRQAEVGWSHDGDPSTYDVLIADHLLTSEGVEPKAWSDYANVPVTASAQQQLIESVRESLRRRLAEYMVPSSFVVLEALPLTPNGKLDRRGLPLPDEWRGRTTAAPPRDGVEAQIANIWREVLCLDSIGVHDNFFDLGGHSLLLVKVHNRLTQLFGTNLRIVDLFRLPTINALARAIEGASAPAGASAPGGAS